MSPALASGFFTTESQGKPVCGFSDDRNSDMIFHCSLGSPFSNNEQY